MPTSLRREILWVLFGCLGLLAPLTVGWIQSPYTFARDDFQSQYMPGFYEMVQAVSHDGEFPLLTKLSYRCNALAGEYQYGVFSPVQWAVLWPLFHSPLTMNQIGAVYQTVHLMLFFVGVYVLARRMGIDCHWAVMAGWSATLNGYMLRFGIDWSPTVASMAWLPWCWWAALHVVEPGASWRWSVLGGVFGALLVLAGWPYSVVSLGLVLGFVGLQSLVKGDIGALIRMIVMGLLMLGWSAPAWMMLLEYSGVCPRTVGRSVWSWEYVQNLHTWAGLVIPSASPPYHLREAALQDGFVPLCMVLWGLVACRWWKPPIANLPIFPMTLLLVVLLTCPSRMPFQWSFRWLPLFHLCVGLLGGWFASRDPKEAIIRLKPADIALLLIALHGIGYAIFDFDRAMERPVMLAVLLACAILWRVSDRWVCLGKVTPLLAMLVIVTTFLVQFPFQFGMTLDFEQDLHDRKGLDPDRIYLMVYSGDDVFPKDGRTLSTGGPLWPGNVHFFSGVRAFGGYTPLNHVGIALMLGHGSVHGFYPIEDFGFARGKALEDLYERLGIDGLVLHHGRLPKGMPFEGFEKVIDLPFAEVWHRTGATRPGVRSVSKALIVPNELEVWKRMKEDQLLHPLVEIADAPSRVRDYGPVELSNVIEGRQRVRAEIKSDPIHPGLVHWTRLWLPGYRAWLDGKELPVLRMDTLMPAVEIPAGSSGVLELRYRPDSLTRSFWFLGAAILLGLMLVRRRA